MAFAWFSQINKLIQTVSEIASNDAIYKNNLTLVYELDSELHRKMDEHLYHVAHPGSFGEDFEHRDEVVIEIAGILVKFIKKD